MKKNILFLLTFIVLGVFLAQIERHSGPLDPHGGRNCWINCEQKGLYQGEYYFPSEGEEFP